MAKTPPCLLLPGLCMGVCSLLGHHATGWLGELRPGALWNLLHTGLVAGAGLRVWPELRLNHPVLLSHLSHRHHCLLLRHDHLQGQVLHKGGLALWHPHQKQPHSWDEAHKGGWKVRGKVLKEKRHCWTQICDGNMYCILLQVAMLICAGFLIAWIPYAVVSVVSAFGEPDSVPIPVSVVPTLLAKSSAMYNPIIYQVVDLKHPCSKFSCFKVQKNHRHFRKSR